MTTRSAMSRSSASVRRPRKGLRVAVDCANGAMFEVGPRALERLGAHVVTIGNRPDGTNINVGCGATDLRLLSQTVRGGGFDLGVAFDGDGDRMLAVDAGERNWTATDRCHRRPSPRCRPRRCDGDDEPRLPPAYGGARDPRPDDACRRPLRPRGASPGGREARRRAVRPHHVPRGAYDRGRPGRRPPPRPGAPRERAQAFVTSPPRCGSCRRRGPTSRCVQRRFRRPSRDEIGSLAIGGRVVVRPSGTEPVVRVLVEAETEEAAKSLCGRIASLVSRELG